MSLLAQWRITSAGLIAVGAFPLAFSIAAWIRGGPVREEDRAPIDRVFPFLLLAIGGIPIIIGARELLIDPQVAYAHGAARDAAAQVLARRLTWGAGILGAASALSCFIQDGKRAYRITTTLVMILLTLLCARASLPGLSP